MRLSRFNRTLLGNPCGFTPGPVTCFVLTVYFGLLAALLSVHHTVPASPSQHSLPSSLNLTEAWDDLQALASSFHPYNSHTNDLVREWLLARIGTILDVNNARHSIIDEKLSAPGGRPFVSTGGDSQVIIFNDLISNSTFSSSKTGRESVYFEGTNIVVYIRGVNDDDIPHWWKPGNGTDSTISKHSNKRGVLVNAHYDSVSTGYGATDDGVGVITILQLIKHFTTKGHQPRRGIIALLNNGEEDYLNGAHAFAQHPSSKFPDTFVNLEGAGAGGRATIFRSSDAEVTRSYQNSPSPFGTVVSADGFKQGLVRSGTDYSVFQEIGLRGLDVAFMEPRSRYHTFEDSSRRTGKDSIWHMLSAALATTSHLTSETAAGFSGKGPSQAVYFDILGRAFAVMSLDLLFALSIFLLVIAPPILFTIAFILRRQDRWYLFTVKMTSDVLDPHAPDEPVDVAFGGWHGFLRYPIAFVLASAATAAIAVLLVNVNPLIVYSSPYAVWSTLLSTWCVIAWIILRVADYVRPSALHRAHALGWLYALSWFLLLVAIIVEARLKIASGYLLLFFNVAIFLALIISYLEFAALPRRAEYASSIVHANPLGEDQNEVGEAEHRPNSSSSRRPRSSGISSSLQPRTERSRNISPTETTSLLRSQSRATRSASRQHQPRSTSTKKQPYLNEQAWSAHLPATLWLLQLFLLVPFNLILVGQVALFLTSALAQTPADGSNPATIYYSMAAVSVLVLAPASPFIHRISWRVPLFLFAVLVGTTMYNVMAFPFSDRARLKIFFVQHLDLESGANNVTLTGIDGYVQRVVAALPSTAGKDVECTSDPVKVIRPGLTTCSWPGLAPRVVPDSSHGNVTYGNRTDYASWLTFNALLLPSGSPGSDRSISEKNRPENSSTSAVFTISGRSTRSCRLLFTSPLSSYAITNASAHDPRFVKIPDGGVYDLRLWSRTWDRTWEVEAQLKQNDVSGGNGEGREKGGESFQGKAVCMWSDANDEANIPALTEVRRFMPFWAQVSKAGDGLVEGWKAFSL